MFYVTIKFRDINTDDKSYSPKIVQLMINVEHPPSFNYSIN